MQQDRIISWGNDFPDGYGHTSIDFLRNHGNRELFLKAKSGDETAAVELVKKCIKEDRIIQLRSKYPEALIIPVLAKERAGYNVIPLAYAKVIQNIAGLDIDDKNIFQINTTNHTGACAMQRLLNRAVFDGTVRNGYNYIIVDDVVTQGGTVSCLRHFIKDNGSNVAAVSALAFNRDSSTIALQPETHEDILKKFGRDELEAFLKEKRITRGIEELTNSEARYLLKFKDVDAIRDRAYEIGVQRVLNENRRVFREKSIAIDRVL